MSDTAGQPSASDAASDSCRAPHLPGATRPHGGPSSNLRVVVHPSAEAAGRAVADEIAAPIRERAAQGRRAVLGLATGSTPLGVYEELIRLHRDEGLSFRNVLTFNLDEYFPMQPDSLQSYRRFMDENFFDQIDIDKAGTHVPDGALPPDRVADFCADYERKIAEAGGIDIQLLGIGRTGHIGFNEPGSPRDSRTRLVTLDKVTRMDAASDFFGEWNVPRQAITMGVGTILDARRVILLSFGEHKSAIIRRSVEGEVSSSVAASFLQQHPRAGFILDPAAAAELTRCKTPWLLGRIEEVGLTWDFSTMRRAVIWLAQQIGKPILKLTEEDYNEHGLQELLAARGSAYDVNIRVFRAMQQTITGWPGGKPAVVKGAGRATSTASAPAAAHADASSRAAAPLDSDAPPHADARALDSQTEPASARSGGPDLFAHASDVFPKRVVVFSPHPDDDVISMGGTFIRLCRQGHEVHVAYQTSGNIAVWDDTARRHMDFVIEFCRTFGMGDGVQKAQRIAERVQEFLRAKHPGEVDSAELQRIKALIRRTEARAAAFYSGVKPAHIHFLDMPFYETGRVRKKPLSPEDVRIIADLLERVRPHQVYAAGDLSDPHGTHRVCLAAIVRAIEGLADRDWMKSCEVWLYRGAWQEWGAHEIEMAVPLSPDEVEAKRKAIFKHESQKDKALFPGPWDPREFWQRAEDRNRATAQLYDKLGLPEYQAIESFVRWSRAM